MDIPATTDMSVVRCTKAFVLSQVGFQDVVDVDVSPTQDHGKFIAGVQDQLNLDPSKIAVSTYDAINDEVLISDISTTQDNETGLLLKRQVNALCPNLEWCRVVKDGEQADGVENARPTWENSSQCYDCRATFTWGIPGLIQPVNRHHCRNCGVSACDAHSMHTMLLPALGYDTPERVCDKCWSLAAPEQKGVSSITEELTFIDTVISEAKNCKKAGKLSSDAMVRLQRIVKALGESHTQNVQTSQVGIAAIKTKLPAVRRLLEDATALGESDLQQGTPSDLEQSVINFSYSSPQLRRLATQLEPFVRIADDREASLKSLTGSFDALISGDALKVTEAIAESSVEVAKLDSHQWVEVFDQKISGLQKIAEEIQLLSRKIESGDGDIQVLSDAHNRSLKLRYEIRAMIVHVTERTIESACSVARCASLKLATTKALLRISSESADICNTFEEMTLKLAEWKDRRSAVVAQGHRKDILLQGNLHHKLTQKVKALEGENTALKSQLEIISRDAEEQVQESDDWKQERQQYERKIADLNCQLFERSVVVVDDAQASDDWLQQRDLLTRRIKILESDLTHAQNIAVNKAPQESNQEDFAKPLEEALEQVRILTMELQATKKTNEEKESAQKNAQERALHKIANLCEENEMLRERLNTEISLNQSHIADLKREIKSSEIATSSIVNENQFILDERDAIRSHLEQLLDRQRTVEEEAEDIRNRGYSAETSLIRYHEALVSIYQSVHPTGGRADEALLALTKDSVLPQKTTSLVGDFVSASSLIQSRFEVLEEELEQALEKIKILELASSDDLIDLSEPPAGTSSSIPASEMPDVPKFSAEIMQLRAMGFDAPRSRLVEVLEQCNGVLQNAANELLN